MKFWLFSVAAVLLAAGCRTAPPVSNGGGNGTVEYCQQADKIIRAIADKDYKNYVRCSGENMLSGDQEKFLSSCKDMESRLGKMGKYTFLTALQTPEVINLVYRIDFSRTSANGKKIEHQQLFQLVFGKVDGQSKLLGMRIM